MRVIIIMTLSTLFANFTETLKKFKRMSLGSKYDEMIYFHTLLNAFINTNKATTNKINDFKNRSLSYVIPLYDNYFDAYKKNYLSKKVKDKKKRGRDYKRFEIINNRD